MSNTALASFRIFIADLDPANPTLTESEAIQFLEMYGIEYVGEDTDFNLWDVRRAAAEALDTIATSETLIGKVIRTQDLTTDATKVAASLRAQADRLRAKATEEENAAADDAGLAILEFEPWRY